MAASSPNASEPLTRLTGAQERFAADLARLNAGELVLLAVSGGPDSMAMLSLAAAALPSGQVSAATVDHGIAAAGHEVAEMVARECARLGVPHAILRPSESIAGASLQAQAREARYALLAGQLAQTGAACIVTAHHADDTAETLLMRAARGSGVAGLAGVRGRTVIAGARAVRPLLGWRRAELRAVVKDAGLAFVDDPANADDRHHRTRVRRLLADHPWLDAASLAQSAAALAEADAEWRQVADWVWDTRARVEGAEVSLDANGAPRELARRLARRAVGAVREAAGIVRPPWSTAANIEPLLDALAAGRSATQAGVLASPGEQGWRFRPAPPRRAP